MQETASEGHEGGRNSTAITASTNGSRKAKPWVPIAKGGCNEAEVPKHGAVFAEGTHFNDKPGKPRKKMPGKVTLSTLITSVIQIRIKLLHEVTEVQGAIMALLDHCLITLQERDKSARLSAKTNLRRHLGQKTSLRISLTFTTNGDYGKRGCKPF
jgi:hypothetical protein